MWNGIFIFILIICIYIFEWMNRKVLVWLEYNLCSQPLHFQSLIGCLYLKKTKQNKTMGKQLKITEVKRKQFDTSQNIKSPCYWNSHMKYGAAQRIKHNCLTAAGAWICETISSKNPAFTYIYVFSFNPQFIHSFIQWIFLPFLALTGSHTSWASTNQNNSRGRGQRQVRLSLSLGK